MAEFILDRFKYNWKGDWTAATTYDRDDIVRVGGKSYVALESHVSDAVFRTDLYYIVPGSSPPLAKPKWRVMTSGRSFDGAWTTGTVYDEGDIVLFGGTLYLCTKGHTAAAFEDNISDWTLFADGIKYESVWVTGTNYGRGSIVKYNGIVYRCIKEHTAGSTLEEVLGEDSTESLWEVFHNGIEFRGSYLPSDNQNTYVYRKNDLVLYGGSILKCILTHSDTGTFDSTKFVVELPGFEYNGTWNANKIYITGDVVRYGGYIFYATQTTQNVAPALLEDSTTGWILLERSYNFRGEYDGSVDYLPGDLVRRGGHTYIAIRTVPGVPGPSDDSTTVNTLNYLDADLWEKVTDGQSFRGNWVTSTNYNIGEVVAFFGSLYECNETHKSADNNHPGDNGSGFYYWDVVVETPNPAGMNQFGDLLTFNLSRTLQGDGSTFGNTSVKIGTDRQVLSIDDDDNIIYRTYYDDEYVVYVTPNGEDKIGNGLTPLYPFKTVNYACQFVEDYLPRNKPSKVKVAGGKYVESAPIIVPALCVVMGDELRTTVIELTTKKKGYVAGDYVYMQNIMQYLMTLLPNLFVNNAVTSLTGNTLTQTIDTSTVSDVATSSLVSANNIVINQYLSYAIESSGTIPTTVGTRIITSDTNRINGATIIKNNRNFLVEQGIAWNDINNTDYTNIDKAWIRQYIERFLIAFEADLKYPGNYRTIRAARHWVNEINGAGKEDMFYMHDATGLRNCTLDGMDGGLNPPGAFDLYQRPTGGAYVSLDPGLGTSDDAVWIKTRSPYIQGVTTLGTGGVGKKIDGALHDGGNKSMVSNDFTQVISDGIGAWVLNNARAELVSVFTYYAQIGYLAEDGGIIRATNGNNSYGEFGSIADGRDATEVPLSGKLNNRTSEAIVGAAYAGEVSDFILAYEYSHSGAEYTVASSDIIGAGANATVIHEEFRDGGVSQARLANSKDSGTPGGGGFLVVEANCQAGNTTTITLSQTDDNEFSDYQNMRIWIVSGPGTGQYGYIQAYDTGTKIASIYKESTNTPGWDHIMPGTPSETTFTTNTRYRIEPRIVYSHPGFSYTTHNNPNARDYRDIVWGLDARSYTDLQATETPGGTTDGITIQTATFNVSVGGYAYGATITNAGAGYAVGDTIKFLGTALGGATPANDCTITVDSISDDSTNSIVTFSVTGTARSGRWVAIGLPNYTMHSYDGENWTEGNLPSVGTWSHIAAGKNTFVALRSDGTSKYAYSVDGINWSDRDFPVSGSWGGIVFGGGRYMVFDTNSNTILWSENGLIWNQTAITDSGDSTTPQWQAITFGAGRHVIISGSEDRNVAVTTDGGVTWTVYDSVLPSPEDSTLATWDWIDIQYGDNVYLAVDRNSLRTAYSFDAQTWLTSVGPSPDDSTQLNWKHLKYAQGVFALIGDTGGKVVGADDTTGPLNKMYTSEDAINWTERTIDEKLWGSIAFGNPSGDGYWVAVAYNDSVAGGINKIRTGARALVRPTISGGKVGSIRIFEPGSGYDPLNPPTYTVYGNFTVELDLDNRIFNGCLAQPSFVNRGIGYRTSSTVITITGNGYADIIPQGNIIYLENLTKMPGPGVQIIFPGIPDEDTADENDLKIFTGVIITPEGSTGYDGTDYPGQPDENGYFKAKFQISPSLKEEYTDNNWTAHGVSVTLRERYSQCRITGHDFLDIGTGNFIQTNYPELYAGGAYFVAKPENEVYELDGGKVFYTSTDQDGNFRAGELFSVQQSTGIVTISAEYFDLDGLSELALGGVRLGGSGAVVREFSTDQTFFEDSNNVIPTQRAIAAFLANRLSEGGSELETNQLVAGVTLLGSSQNLISTTSGAEILLPKLMKIQGNDANLSGSILAQTMLLRPNDDSNSVF